MNSSRKRIAIGSLLVAGMLLCGIASATPIVMDFDGLSPGTSVHNYYNGGCSTAGLVFPHSVDCGGPDYGVKWKGTHVSSLPPPFDEPSEPNIMGFGLFSDHATMNVAAGFDTGLSFYYSYPVGLLPASVQVFSGRNGRGDLLAEVSLAQTGLVCGGVMPCWDFVSMAFDGLARSVIFAGGPLIGFDDVTLGLAAPTPVPEPGALGMFGLAVLLLGGIRVTRRRRVLDA